MRAGVPRGFEGEDTIRFGGDRVGCLLTSTPAGTAASTHAHASSRWSAGRFAHRSSPRTARRAGTCVDANASCERGGSTGGGRGCGIVVRRTRATGDPLDETTGAPPRPRRSASPRARPSRARGASRTHRRTPPTARSRRRTPSSSIPRPCARRSDAVGFKPSAGGAHAVAQSDCDGERRSTRCFVRRAVLGSRNTLPRLSARSPLRPRAVGVRAPRFARVAMPRRHVALALVVALFAASLAGAPADARLLLDAASSPGVLGRAEFVSCPA